MERHPGRGEKHLGGGKTSIGRERDKTTEEEREEKKREGKGRREKRRDVANVGKEGSDKTSS